MLYGFDIVLPIDALGARTYIHIVPRTYIHIVPHELTYIVKEAYDNSKRGLLQ